MREASDYAVFIGTCAIVGGVVGALVAPPLLAIAGLGLVIVLFGKATGPVEAEVMRQAESGGGCGLMLLLIVGGVLFWLVVGGGFVALLGGG